MAKEVIMPKFGMTQETGTIVTWLKGDGDVVEKGEPIAEVETDKINMEIEAPADGILGGLLYSEGDEVPVTTIIAYILAEGEALPAGQESASPTVKATPVAQRIAAERGIALETVQGSGRGGKITRQDVESLRVTAPTDGKLRATPAARRVAREHEVALESINGSGPNGRIQEADILATIADTPSVAVKTSGVPEPTVIPLEGMRRTIAQRMQTSYQQAPHIMFTASVNMTASMALRDMANERRPQNQPKVSMTALLVKACAYSLREHPLVNSLFHNEQILMMPDVHIGVAVALDEGLIVPVIRHADRKGLLQLGADVNDLASRARSGELAPADVSDGTFTISNLGMFGIDHFTAIINPPQVAILAVGRIEWRFVPDKNRQPVAQPMMIMTLSVDHRVVDGALAAQFMQTLREALETPTSILL